MKSKLLLFVAGVVALSFVPQLALAGGEPANFSWLVGIPGVQGGGFNQYINALYALAISLAALIAVVKIVIAGAKYMMDDIVTHKSEAKQDIKNALIGLLIVIGAVIILNTINTDLTNVQVDATPATVNDDPLEFVSRFENQCNEAAAQQSSCERVTCSSFINSNITDEWCREMCRNVYGGYMDYTGINECFYIQAVADNCDAQGTRQCCESVQGGTWNDTGTRCTDLEEGVEERINACYDGGNGTWDNANNTCLTTDCNRRTDQRCCEIGYNGTYANGDCSIDTFNEEQDAENGTQDYQASQCVTVDGGLWNYTTGQCDNRDTQYDYDVISNQLYVDPNGNPQEVCASLEEQMGITVEYVASIRSCRWSR